MLHIIARTDTVDTTRMCYSRCADAVARIGSQVQTRGWLGPRGIAASGPRHYERIVVSATVRGDVKTAAGCQFRVSRRSCPSAPRGHRPWMSTSRGRLAAGCDRLRARRPPSTRCRSRLGRCRDDGQAGGAAPTVIATTTRMPRIPRRRPSASNLSRRLARRPTRIPEPPVRSRPSSGP